MTRVTAQLSQPICSPFWRSAESWPLLSLLLPWSSCFANATETQHSQSHAVPMKVSQVPFRTHFRLQYRASEMPFIMATFTQLDWEELVFQFKVSFLSQLLNKNTIDCPFPRRHLPLFQNESWCKRIYN